MKCKRTTDGRKHGRAALPVMRQQAIKDASTIRKDNAPVNLSLLKKVILNLLRMDTSGQRKASLRLKRKRAAWDDDLRAQLLGLKPL